jgi:hypothetical protein
VYPREDVAEILGGKLDGLPKNVRDTTRIPLGTHRGLRFGVGCSRRLVQQAGPKLNTYRIAG